jgi:hypothetical protein
VKGMCEEPCGACVVEEILVERHAQDDKWGQQNHPDGTAQHYDDLAAEQAKNVCAARAQNGTITWRDILHEEVKEAFAESDQTNLRTELIQVAAVAVAWVEAIDRRAA